MSLFWLAQFIGSIAVVLGLAAYQAKRRQTILGLTSLNSLFSATQFALLGAYTGMAMNLVAAARNLTFLKTPLPRRHRWPLFIFMGAALLLMTLTWQGPISLLALSGNWFNALATWQSDPKRLRLLAACAPPFWIAYGLITQSYPTFFIQGFILISVLVGHYRLDRPNRQVNKLPI